MEPAKSRAVASVPLPMPLHCIQCYQTPFPAKGDLVMKLHDSVANPLLRAMIEPAKSGTV